MPRAKKVRPSKEKMAPPATPEGEQSASKPKGVNQKLRAGNGKGVTVEKVSFSKSKPDSWSNLLLVCAYIVQTRGGATVSQVLEDLKRLGVIRLKDQTISDAVEALRKQDIIAVSQNAAGNRVYSMKRVKFNCNPEVASVSALIQVLRSDATGQLILEKFKKPDKEKKPWPTKPQDICFSFRLTDDVLGSQIWAGNPTLQRRYFDAPNNHTLHQKSNGSLKKNAKGHYVLKPEFEDHNNVPMMFDRWHDGRIVAAHPATLRGFFRCAVQALQPPGERIITGADVERFFSLEHLLTDVSLDVDELIVEDPEMETDMRKLPVMRSGENQNKGGSSATPKNYETIPAGTTLTMVLTIPTKDFMTPAQFKEWIAVALRRNAGFFSPARGRQCGAAELVSVHTKPTFGDGDWQEV